MAETTKRDEATFDEKRKPDSCCEARDEYPSKIQKLEGVDSESCQAVKNGENGDHNHNAEHIDDDSLFSEGKDGEAGADVEAEEADHDEEDGDDYEDEDDGEDDEEEYDSEDGEKSSGNAAGDRKGKGIMNDLKGKGKLIEEDEDEDDSSDGGSELDGDESDLSDDPLAEVDLDNILPSRTRRRTVQPGVYIANDLGNDDDDSDDSDA